MNSLEDPEPYHTFALWYQEHLKTSTSKHPAACVLSTLGNDGYPNARNLALKELKYPYFVITGSLDSRKEKEINNHSKIALTFWWEASLHQVRVQGTATTIDRKTAELLFSQRSRSAQLVSAVSNQGKTLDSIENLENDIRKYAEQLGESAVPCLENWGGYQILPIRVEFIEFRTDRLHQRTLYTFDNNKWTMSLLQP